MLTQMFSLFKSIFTKYRSSFGKDFITQQIVLPIIEIWKHTVKKHIVIIKFT